MNDNCTWRRPIAAVAALLAATAMIGTAAPASYAADGDPAAVRADGVIRGAAEAVDADGDTAAKDGEGQPGGGGGGKDDAGAGKPDPDGGTTDPKPDPEQPDPEPKPEPEPEPEPTLSEPKATSPVPRHEPVGVGSTIADVIDVTGFPDDHTAVDGDAPHMRVSLWWWSGRPNFDSIKAGDLFNDLNRPVGEIEPTEDDNHELIGRWNYPAVNGQIVVGAGEKDASGKAVDITADKTGWYVFMWRFDGDDRAKAAATRFDDLGHAHVVIREAQRQDQAPQPDPAPKPDPAPSPTTPDTTDGGDVPKVVNGDVPEGGDTNGAGDGNELPDADDALRKLAAAKKYTNGNNPLAKTGVNVGAIVLVVLAVLAVGVFMLAVIRRHKS